VSSNKAFKSFGNWFIIKDCHPDPVHQMMERSLEIDVTGINQGI